MRIKVRLAKIIEWLLTLGIRDTIAYQSVDPDADSYTVPNEEQTQGGENISAYIVTGASMSRIDAMEDKQYWERKFTKDDIIALKNMMGVTLPKEYEEKLKMLDVVRPGDLIFVPTDKESDNEEEKAKVKDEALLLKLSLYIKGKDAPRQFLEAARRLHTNKDIIFLTKKYYDNQLIIGNSKDLYNILLEEKLYTKSYNNWRSQLNKLLLKESQKKSKLD